MRILALLVLVLLTGCSDEPEATESKSKPKSMSLHPEYPVVEGRHQMTKDWSVELPSKFNRRVEDGDLVLWKPGFTIWTIAWNNDKLESQEQRLGWIKGETSPEAFDALSDSADGILRYSYRIREGSDDNRQPPFHGFAIGTKGHIQMAIYFDSPDAIDEASAIFRSLKETPTKE
jgi:hypothetical protein